MKTEAVAVPAVAIVQDQDIVNKFPRLPFVLWVTSWFHCIVTEGYFEKKSFQTEVSFNYF